MLCVFWRAGIITKRVLGADSALPVYGGRNRRKEMRLKPWKDCTLSQKIARVTIAAPFAVATVSYLIAGSWLFYVLMKK